MRFSTVGRVVVAGGAAVGLFLGAAACSGNDVDKGKLVSKLKSESTFEGMTDSQLDCVADTVIKHSKGDSLSKYVDGKGSFEKVKVDDEDKAGKDLAKCIIK